MANETLIARVEAELLARSWLQRTGGPNVYVVTGQPGMGKSTLLAEATQAVKGQAIVATGRAERVAEGVDSFLPFRDVVIGLVGSGERLPRRTRRAAKRLARAAAELMPDVVTVIFPPLGLALKAGMLGRRALRDPVHDDTARADFTGGLEAFIEALPADRPIVVAIDDFHWADEPSCDLALYLARRVDHPGFHLALFTRPPSEQPPHVTATLGELARLETFQELQLRAFTEQDVQALLRDHFPACPVDPRLASLLTDRTGGNPYLIQRWLSHLTRTQAVVSHDGFVALDESALESIPDGFEPILDAELSTVNDQMRPLLDAASVLGEVFDPGIAARLTGLDELEALRLLASLQRTTGLLEEAGETGDLYCFNHSLLRDHIYRQIPRRLRQEYHAHAAELLLQSEASTAVVGHHLRAAGRLEDALPFLLEAARDDLARGAYRSAAERLEGLPAPAEPSDRSHFFMTRAQAEVGAGDVPAAVQALREWENTEGPLPEQGRLLQAEAKHLAGEYAAARQIVEPLCRQGMASALIRSLHYQRFTDPAAAEEQALAIDASDFSDSERQQFEYVVAANIWLLRDKLDAADRQLSMLLNAAIDAGHNEQAAACARRLAELAMFRGELDRAEALIADGRERAELSGSRQRVYLLTTAAELARHRGDWAQADALLAAARERVALLGIPLWQAHVELATAELERQRDEDWRQPLSRAHSLYSRIGVDWGMLHCRITKALAAGESVLELAAYAEEVGILTEFRWLKESNQEHMRHPIMFL